MAMAIIELVPHPQPRGAARASRDGSGEIRQTRRRAAVAEVGHTMGVLMLIAIGIVALRFVLAAAYGALH
jgi:hypothetical protein